MKTDSHKWFQLKTLAGPKYLQIVLYQAPKLAAQVSGVSGPQCLFCKEGIFLNLRLLQTQDPRTA